MLTRLHPRTITRLLAALIGLLAVGTVAGADRASLPVAAIVAVALALVAAGLLLRWPFARVSALVAVALVAAVFLLATAYNVFMVVALFPPSAMQVAVSALTLLVGGVGALVARWLQGSQAKAWFAGRAE